MKKTAIALLVLVLLLFFVLPSCGDSTAAVLVGRWETEGEDAALGSYTMVYHFTEKGEIFIEQKQGDAIPFSIPFGSWQTDGKELTVESDGSERIFTFSVSGDTLTLRAEGEEELVFRRLEF